MITETIAPGGEGRIGIELREFRADDLDAMYALDVECFEPVFRFSRRAIQQYSTAPGAVSLLAEVDGELVGFAIAEMDTMQHMGYLVTLDVSPEWRRLGVAKRLMSQVEARARAADVEGMDLHVHAGNTAAIRLYEGLGYRRMGVVPAFYGRGLDAFVYARKLDD